jgi:hypothetical protein
MAPLRAYVFKSGSEQRTFGVGGVHRGSLGIHVDRGGENFSTEEHVTLFSGESLEVEFNCLFNMGDGFFQGGALRLAALQFRAPRVEAILVLLDYDARLAGHMIQV